MSIRRSVIVASVVLVALAACSSDDNPSDTGSTGASSPTTEPTESPSTPTATETPSSGGETEVESEDSTLGTILVDANGNTLYVFLQDTDGTSTCYEGCAPNWPAFIAKGELKAGGGGDVDESLLGTTERDDGKLQVTYNGHPLYHFAGDQAPGDMNGQAIGDVWFVVSPAGEPVTG